jgi:pyruvate-ferredoxin/flavodoxin oxidoreductase
MATRQAVRVKDGRGLPEFIFNPDLGESYLEAFSIKGNKNLNRDWVQMTLTSTGAKYNYTVAHWAATEGRFRRHMKRVKPEELAKFTPLDAMLARITQKDVVNKHYVRKSHRAYTPDFAVYLTAEDDAGKPIHFTLSRQMVLFCVERRKAWRTMQSRAGQENIDYEAQKKLLAKVDGGQVALADFLAKSLELFEAELAPYLSAKPASASAQPAGAAAAS